MTPEEQHKAARIIIDSNLDFIPKIEESSNKLSLIVATSGMTTMAFVTQVISPAENEQIHQMLQEETRRLLHLGEHDG